MEHPGRDRRTDPEAEAAAAPWLRLARRRCGSGRGSCAAVGGGARRRPRAIRLAELRRREFVQEPLPVSPRPGIGRLLVFVRKAAYHLFFKWHARAVLQQQNEFNQAAAALVATLAEREREARRELERLARAASTSSRARLARHAAAGAPAR